jgi:hypothetical protein
MIRRVFLLQTEIGQPDPWDDSINMVNTSINPGLGTSNNPSGYDNFISFFQRVDNRFSLSHSVYSESHIVLKRPFSTHDPETEVQINFDKVAELIDTTVDGIMMLGAILEDKPLSQQEVIASSSWYHRKGDEVIDLVSGETLNNPKIIPWMFCYKTKDLPLYYMVLNPHSVQCLINIEGNYNGNQIYTISNHLKNMNDVIFKPRLSKNARVMGDHNIVVRGDEFTIEPFGTWFVKRHLPDFFKNAKIKIDTNFEYTIKENKIVVSTLNKQRGYISLRWNTGTVMDMTFHASKNRFLQEYIVDVIQ